MSVDLANIRMLRAVADALSYECSVTQDQPTVALLDALALVMNGAATRLAASQPGTMDPLPDWMKPGKPL